MIFDYIGVLQFMDRHKVLFEPNDMLFIHHKRLNGINFIVLKLPTPVHKTVGTLTNAFLDFVFFLEKRMFLYSF